MTNDKESNYKSTGLNQSVDDEQKPVNRSNGLESDIKHSGFNFKT